MKHLKHFESAQEAQTFISNFDGNYGVLLSCDEIPTPFIIEPTPPVITGVTVYFVSATHSCTYTYTYPYESDTILEDYIENIVSEHAELRTGGSYVDDIHDKNENDLRRMLNNTLYEAGIMEGDTIRCVESWK